MLQTGDGRLTHTHPGCELRARHSQGIPDRPDPADVRYRFVGGEPKPVKPGVEVPPGTCTSFAHLANLSATADKDSRHLSPEADNLPELKNWTSHRVRALPWPTWALPAAGFGRPTTAEDSGRQPRDERIIEITSGHPKPTVSPTMVRVARVDQDEERVAHDPIVGPSVVAHDHRDAADPAATPDRPRLGGTVSGPFVTTTAETDAGSSQRSSRRPCQNSSQPSQPTWRNANSNGSMYSPTTTLTGRPDGEVPVKSGAGTASPAVRAPEGIGLSPATNSGSENGSSACRIGVGPQRRRFAFYPGADAPSSITSTPLPLPHHRHDTSSTDSSRTSTSSTVRSPPTEKWWKARVRRVVTTLNRVRLPHAEQR